MNWICSWNGEFAWACAVRQVQQLVELEPGNEEYGEMLGSLKEVIELTEELIRDQQAEEPSSATAAAPVKRSRFGPAVAEVAASVAAAASATAMPAAPVSVPPPAASLPGPAALPISTVGLPAVVAEQIKAAQAKQARSALAGDAPPGWAVGAPRVPTLPVRPKPTLTDRQPQRD
jgi:hypothetical protein